MSTPFTVASDVDMKLVTKLKGRAGGISVRQYYHRVFPPICAGESRGALAEADW